MLRLREMRLQTGKKQITVATELGLSRQAYSHYENGRRDPDTETLKKMADYFGVSVDALLVTETTQEQFDLQIFGKKNVPEANFALAFGKILTLKDEKAKDLTLQIMEDVLHLDIPKLEALSALIKTIK